jgi:hypothetical protein
VTLFVASHGCTHWVSDDIGSSSQFDRTICFNAKGKSIVDVTAPRSKLLPWGAQCIVVVGVQTPAPSEPAPTPTLGQTDAQ